MRLYIFLTAIAGMLLPAGECNNKSTGQKFKGRLEVAGICMNYTISVIEGNPGTDVIVANWTDEVTNKQYTNVFRLGNPCDFPSSLKQGDEFYFVIDTSKGKECAVCMAYYPTPSKSLPIKVVK
ncbi:MAG: hypothetical protein FJY20_04970 [Bacteroidetes bacterium]|nr:hypothetical protein [Bacteroidota bacterium]